MNRIKVVTGYVPIVGHPRSSAEYGALGEKLGEIPVLKKAFYDRLENCWLHKFVEKQNKLLLSPITHSVGDNPAKNTMAYHIVQHQKFEWLGMAALEDPSIDVFIWIDYGIFHVPGVTAAVILDFLAKVNDKDIAIPGCLDAPVAGLAIPDAYPCWRFCGGVMVVPRMQIPALLNAVHTEIRKHTRQTKNISWEVNTLARVERKGKLPIRWYKADHNETMFSGYEVRP